MILSKTSKSFNNLKLNSKSYKTQHTLALRETRHPERSLTGLLLLFSEEWFDRHASAIKITISYQGYICFLGYTTENCSKLLSSPTSCTEEAARSHEARS